MLRRKLQHQQRSSSAASKSEGSPKLDEKPTKSSYIVKLVAASVSE